jgi:hypothetical protein
MQVNWFKLPHDSDAMKRLKYLLTLFGLAALACDPALPLLQNQAEPPPAFTAAATHTPSDPQPAIQTQTPAAVDRACVAPTAADTLAQAAFEEMPNAMLSFLNAGGQAVVLQELLEMREIATPPMPVAVAELTGDGKEDVLVAYFDREEQAAAPRGALLIYTCHEGQFILTHIELSQEFFGAPALLHVQDLDADGKNDVIFSSPTCGANTCFESAKILVWDGEGFENHLQGSSEDLPAPSLQITDYDLNRIYDLEVAGTVFGSIGAGPQRPVTRIWSYDPASGLWLPGEDQPGPSEYRLHVLHDADGALRRGEHQVAILLYEQVINSPDLLDWVEPQNERLNLAAYARFKTVVAHALSGDLNRANAFLDAIRPLYPSNTFQYPYIEMAEVFLNNYLVGQEAGCSAAHSYAAEHAAQILTPLGPQVFGYANPEYTPVDVCP